MLSFSGQHDTGSRHPYHPSFLNKRLYGMFEKVKGTEGAVVFDVAIQRPPKMPTTSDHLYLRSSDEIKDCLVLNLHPAHDMFSHTVK